MGRCHERAKLRLLWSGDLPKGPGLALLLFSVRGS